VGNSGTVCVVQNDQGTSTSCWYWRYIWTKWFSTNSKR
jgi:hypothetical protein